MAELEFPRTPVGTLGELWSAIIALLPQLGRRPVVRKDQAIAATETAVAHGLGFVPKMAIPVGQANVACWRSRVPDSRCVYLIAASAVTVDVVIIP
jgi:hypothetical protein